MCVVAKTSEIHAELKRIILTLEMQPTSWFAPLDGKYFGGNLQ